MTRDVLESRQADAEQAALRRVATLVAGGAPPQDLFAAVVAEVGAIFDWPWVGLMRYEADDSFVVVATWGDHPFAVGSRWPLDGPSTFEAVWRTGQPARIADYEGLPGAVAEAARTRGIVGGVGAPIVVNGATWGVIAAPLTAARGIPEGAEVRLNRFTELVAVAIANAESQGAMARLVDEQTALRRVATIAARESSPADVFRAVTDEAARVLEIEAVGMLRFEADEAATLVAQSQTPWDPPPLGTRLPLDGENLVAAVHRTGQAARMDDWSTATGSVAAMADVLGVRSAVATPIVVEGRLWGTLIAATSQSDPLRADTESRLEAFTEVVATAISNAESREALAAVAEDQEALRRMATLVAEGAEPTDVSASVTAEVCRFFGRGVATIARFEDDGSGMVILGLAGTDGFEPTASVGAHWPLDGSMASTAVYTTRRSARKDMVDWSQHDSPHAKAAREIGVVSSVAVPIVVGGRCWGALSLSADQPLPPDTDERLERFSEIVSTAIANADARGRLARLVDEQTALRRVATLVAEGVAPAELFSAVVVELAGVFSDVDPALVASVIKFDPGPECTLVGASRPYEHEAVGARWTPKDLYVSTRVLRSGRSARVDEVDLDSMGGPDAEVLRLRGFLFQVGCPIVVEGRLWGAMCLNSKESLPADTDGRLESFTGLVATAIANAESREALAELAGEQTALRRIATLVAQGLEPEEIFAAVADEVADTFGCIASAHRFEQDESVMVGLSRGVDIAIGSRWKLMDGMASAGVYRTGRSARVEGFDWSSVSGRAAKTAARLGIVSQVGCPIMVEGDLWGAMTLNATEPLPPDTEERLEKFTELVATAISNAESRGAVERLADEQAALRRVATFVAKELPLADVLAGVADELVNVLGEIEWSLARDDGDGMATLLAASEHSPTPPGTRVPLVAGGALGRAIAEGRPARVDDFVAETGDGAHLARKYGIRALVSYPIVVRGKTWGALSVGSRTPAFPPETETLLSRFSDLVATAVANGEARAEVERLADEQAALRRVAELVAGGSGPEEVFRVVASEVSVLFGADVGAIVRFEDDGMATVLGDVGGPHAAGKRVTLDPGYVVHGVRETSRSARFDTDDPSTADTSSLVHSLGIRSAVASPIVVEGQLWGAITAGSVAGPLASGAEQRLNEFTSLVATAVANTQAREQLTALADEQAALRRVATLVADQTAPEEIYAAVAEEVARLLHADRAAVGRYELHESMTVTAYWSVDGTAVPVGTRIPLAGDVVTATVRRSGRPVRIESFDDLSGPLIDYAREVGPEPPSTIGAPILVEGQPWGIVFVSSMKAEPLPDDAESRVVRFTELIATAVVNAQARDDVRDLANEQAALRRVATLVARGASAAEVFDAVGAEMGWLFAADAVTLSRYEPDDAIIVLAHGGLAATMAPAGTRFSLTGENVAATVRRTRRAARLEDYTDADGPIAELMRENGVHSTVGVPIVVDGKLWAVASLHWRQSESPPADTEERMVQFAELLGTAIANTQAREQVTTLADEQAALRRVATLVAEGVAPSEIFEAVSKEVQGVLHLEASPSDVATVVRFDPGPECVLVGMSKPIEENPLGDRWEPHDAYVSTRVLRTGRSSRVDEDDLAVEGPEAEKMRRQGFLSQVASPILVEGRMWGAMTASAREPLPPDTEARLEKFTELVATAIANAENKSELAASRMRIVAASDDARRRIERDLHDGMQQRLVTLGLTAGAAGADRGLDEDGLRAELARMATGVAQAIDDLQELSRGIHPAILSNGGLAPALEMLALRSAIPVSLEVATEKRFPEAIEIATYFVASEALANAAKHAQASRIDVALRLEGDCLRVSIRDDGVGGVDPARGSGLVGLTDRVEALGGSLDIQSQTGTGTQLVATLPLMYDPSRDGGIAAGTTPDSSVRQRLA